MISFVKIPQGEGEGSGLVIFIYFRFNWKFPRYSCILHNRFWKVLKIYILKIYLNAISQPLKINSWNMKVIIKRYKRSYYLCRQYIKQFSLTSCKKHLYLFQIITFKIHCFYYMVIIINHHFKSNSNINNIAPKNISNESGGEYKAT